MEEHWGAYLTRVNDELASIAVNIGIGSTAPPEGYTHFLWVSLTLQKQCEDGLADASELDALSEIEDALTERLTEKCNAYDVGRITTQGLQDFFYYLPGDKETASLVQEVMSQHPNYEFRSGKREDVDWSHYFEILYPSPEEFQCIANAHLVQHLEGLGDDLSKPRAVEHWIYFESPAQRDEYLKAVTSKGFQLVNLSEKEDPDASHRFGLVIGRVDKVDLPSIDEVVLELFALASEMNGDYDGWETSVEK